MAKPFRRLTEGLPAARRARIDGQAEALVAEHALLRVLRRERTVTEAEFAAIMGVRQASISRRENQNDMRLGTLRRYAEALGGELEIHVRFPPELVRLFARALLRVEFDRVPSGDGVEIRYLMDPRLFDLTGDRPGLESLLRDPARVSGLSVDRRSLHVVRGYAAKAAVSASVLPRGASPAGHHDGCRVPSPSSTTPHRRPWRTSCAASFAEMRASLGRTVCRGRCVPGSVNGLRLANAYVRLVCVGGCGIGATR